MNTTQQLPKNMTVKLACMSPLIVKDHNVVSSDGFFGWIIDVVTLPEWVKLLKTIRKRGVTFKVAKNILISEIKENYKHISSLVWFDYEVTDSVSWHINSQKVRREGKLQMQLSDDSKNVTTGTILKVMLKDNSAFS